MKELENKPMLCPKCGKSEKVMKQSVFLGIMGFVSFCISCCMLLSIILIPGALFGFLFTAVVTLMIPFSFNKYVCLDCANIWKPKKHKIGKLEMEN